MNSSEYEYALFETISDLLEIVDACPIDIYFGGSVNAYVPYPYRLVSAGNVGELVPDRAGKLMIDSNIDDTDVSNRQVVRAAVRTNADYVIPKDYYGCENHIDKTHESLAEFLNIYEKLGCSEKIIVPLQADHSEHYRRHEDLLGEFSHFAVGGMRDASPEAQAQALRDTRNALGDDRYIHALGMGTSRHLVDVLQQDPNLIDSLDATTFETLPGRYGAIADADWKQHPLDLPGGEKVGRLHAVLALYHGLLLNYQLSPLCNDNTTATQTDLPSATSD